jgi:hypothetical protein
MTNTIEITRRTRLGWGVNACCEQGEHGLIVPPPSKPDYFGTVKTLLAEIETDRYVQSLGDTYHTSSWFVKVDGDWKRVKRHAYYGPADLLNMREGVYDITAVDVEYVQ